MVEMAVGTGNAGGTRQTPTTWPSGGRIIDIEVNVALGPGAFQALDSSIDYRCRWLTCTGQLLNSATFPNLQPGGADDNRQYPWDGISAAAYPTIVLSLINAPHYTDLGWDAASARAAIAGQSFNQFLNIASVSLMPVYLYADPFTGGLTLKNDMANPWRGMIRVTAGEQLGARVVLP